MEITFNVNIFINLFLYAAAATAGVISTNKLISLLFEEVVRRRHYRWTTKYKERSDLAKAVVALCAEGAAHGWERLPRDQDHAYFIAALLDGAHKKAGALFSECLSNWIINATIYSLPSEIESSADTRKFSRELQKTAQSSCDKVLTIVQKWR